MTRSPGNCSRAATTTTLRRYTSTAAELHRAGIGHPLAFQTEVRHRLAGGFVQRADLVMRAPASKVPVLLEIDRRSEEAHVRLAGDLGIIPFTAQRTVWPLEAFYVHDVQAR